jgi:hypothetical protein
LLFFSHWMLACFFFWFNFSLLFFSQWMLACFFFWFNFSLLFFFSMNACLLLFLI